MDLDALIERMKSNNITAIVTDDRAEALRNVIELVPRGATVSFGGSQSVAEIGAWDYFLREQATYRVINPYESGISPEESYERRRRALLADAYITGTNAVTLAGELVNVDHHGNRVAAIGFGPKRVIVIVGINKIVLNLAEARRRIKLIAAPLNSARLKRGNPCEKSGKCESCGLPTRICRNYSVIEAQSLPYRLYVIIVKENLGY